MRAVGFLYSMKCNNCNSKRFFLRLYGDARMDVEIDKHEQNTGKYLIRLQTKSKEALCAKCKNKIKTP